MTSDTEPADVLATRLAFGLWGTRGVRTYARVGGEYRDGHTVYRGVAGYTVVTGTARQLYLALWNRGSEVEESGAPGWLAAWAARVRVSWT